MEHVWRLIFSLDGDKFTIKSMRKLVKRAPRGQPLTAVPAGRFIEVRGKDQRALYRRNIGEILAATVEYPTGDPARPLGRVPAPHQREVVILVPAPEEGHSAAIVVATQPGQSDKNPKQASVDAGAVRDLIVVELPREGAEK